MTLTDREKQCLAYIIEFGMAPGAFNNGDLMGAVNTFAVCAGYDAPVDNAQIAQTVLAFTVHWDEVRFREDPDGCVTWLLARLARDLGDPTNPPTAGGLFALASCLCPEACGVVSLVSGATTDTAAPIIIGLQKRQYPAGARRFPPRLARPGQAEKSAKWLAAALVAAGLD